MIKSFISNIIALIVVFFPKNSFGEITFKSEVKPSNVVVGEAATWIITAENAMIRQTSFKPPFVQNLKINYESGSFNTRIINGVTQRSTVWKFNVIPSTEGDYIIPESTINIEGQNFVIPSCSFTATKNAISSQKNSDVVFIKLEYKQPEKWYIGQNCPAELKLYIAGGISGQLASMPQKYGDAFSATKLLEQPKQTVVKVNGAEYQCLSWPTLITPLKSGINQLNFGLEMIVSMPSRLRSNMFDDEDDDPFSIFTRGFGGMFAQNKNISLSKPSEAINILPLSASRPSNFSEGIGVFKISDPQILEKEAIQNEPLTMAVEISGHGNFDRLQEPKINCNNSDWRTYSPKAVFESDDFLGFTGKMRYEFVIVPLKSGELTLPEIEFVYFDTTTGEFITLSAKCTTTIFAKPPIHRTQKTDSSEATPTLAKNTFLPNGIILQFEKLSTQSNNLKIFWLIQILALSTFIFFCAAKYKLMKNLSNPMFLARKAFTAELKNCLNSAKNAIDNKNVEKWYDAAYKALNLSFSLKTNALTQLEIHSTDDFLQKGIKLSTDAEKFAAEILEINNLIKFGDSNQHFPEHTENLQQLLKELK